MERITVCLLLFWNVCPLLTDDPGTTAYDPGSDAYDPGNTGKVHLCQ